MKSTTLLAYQVLIGCSDAGTGILLCLAPLLTLRLMGLHPPPDAAPYIAYIGAFVLSVGAACLYGALLIVRHDSHERLETVWLITAFCRSSVAIYIVKSISVGQMEPSWISVALFDGACALIQAIGLRKRWLRDGI